VRRAEAVTLAVEPGVSPRWAEIEPSPPLLASKPWLDAIGDRLGGEPCSLLLSGRGRISVAAFGSILADPDAYEAVNVHRLLAGVPPVYPLDPRAEEARARAVSGLPPPAEWLPSLVLVSPGYECVPVGADADDPAALAAFLRAVAARAAGLGCRVASCLYVPRERPVLADRLAEAGWSCAPLVGRSRLSLAGCSSFGDWLARLGSARRAQVRRERRVLREAGVRTERRPLAEHFEDVVRLRSNLVAKYGGYSTPQAERERLERLLAAFGPRLVLFCSVAEGETIAFSLLVEEGPAWYPLWTGQEYGHPKARHLYFEAVFYAPVEAAIESGVETIDLGVGHSLAKRLRGATALPRDGWFLALDQRLERPLATAVDALARSCLPELA
jgi:uncharacterized protein